jgi:vanillate/3-O-methylgallate O-demethylase
MTNERQTMTNATFSAPLAMPFYQDHVLYHVIESAGVPAIRAWQFSGWQAESTSWKNGCYIHAGLSNTGPLSLKGPDAENSSRACASTASPSFRLAV